MTQNSIEFSVLALTNEPTYNYIKSMCASYENVKVSQSQNASEVRY